VFRENPQKYIGTFRDVDSAFKSQENEYDNHVVIAVPMPYEVTSHAFGITNMVLRQADKRWASIIAK
jgi:hypothetical protein|tara:strand:+ start:336 stop:536 length:201 start_codon:yes stop_codon:yes gene_type:complete